MIKKVVRRFGWTASVGRKAPRPFRYAVLEHASGERTFAKTYPAHARQEFRRGQALFEIGQRTGLFCAPRPLELFEQRNIIVWEYLEGLVELRDYLVEHGSERPCWSRRCEEMLFDSGRALAALHEGLLGVTGSEEFSPIPEVHSGHPSLDRHVSERLAKTPRRPLHWDYACGNLFVSPSSQGPSRLVILDAMPNHYVLQKHGPDVISPIYVDIAQMIFSLCCHPRFSRKIGDAAGGYVTQFLAGYSMQSGTTLDQAVAFACAGELTHMYQRLRDREEAGRRSIVAVLDRRFRLRAARRLNEAALKCLPEGEATVPARSVARKVEKADGCLVPK